MCLHFTADPFSLLMEPWKGMLNHSSVADLHQRFQYDQFELHSLVVFVFWLQLVWKTNGH